MRTDTLKAVERALEKHPQLTTKDYAEMCKLSLGTVYRALEKLHAEEVPNTYPVRWKPAPSHAAQPLYVNKDNVLVAQINRLPKPYDPGQFSPTQTLQEASQLAQTVITTGKLNLGMELGTDLSDYRKELGRYASHIMTMLWHVEALLGHPEWKIKAGIIPDITKD